MRLDKGAKNSATNYNKLGVYDKLSRIEWASNVVK